MKKILLGVAVAALFVNQAGAWEFKNNPDRRPSWAVGYWKGNLSGDAQRTEIIPIFGFGLRDVYKTPTAISTQILKPSVRLPLSDDVTLELEYQYTWQDFDSSNGLGTYKGELSGSMMGGTFRKYF